MVELCHIPSRGQRVIFETNLTRCFFHRWKSTIESRVERIVWRGGVKVYWKRNGNGLSVSRSRQKRRFYRVCTRACMRPPTRSRRAHAELEYMYNENEAEDKGAGMWEDAPRNCRKGDELFARRSCLPEICHGFSFRWKDLITRRETLNNAKKTG